MIGFRGGRQVSRYSEAEEFIKENENTVKSLSNIIGTEALTAINIGILTDTTMRIYKTLAEIADIIEGGDA